MTGFYNRDEECLLRGTDWVFKHNRSPSVFKRLIRVSFDVAVNTIRDYTRVSFKNIFCNVLSSLAYCIQFCVNLLQTKTDCHAVEITTQTILRQEQNQNLTLVLG